MATRSSQKRRLRDERQQRERERQRELERLAARRRRGGLLVAALLAGGAAAAVVVALSGGADGGRGQGDGASAAQIMDVHGVGVDPADGALYIATHSGLFRSPRGAASARRVDAPEQDLMGFSVAGPNRFLASGHPGPGQDLPAALGVIESVDRGRTWRSLSLQGEADLHVLRASGSTAYAYDGRLMVSRDRGATWEERRAPGELVDLAPSPGDADRLLASTGDGVQVSPDGGRTWDKADLDRPVLLAWGPDDRASAVDGEGNVYQTNDGGRSWKPAGNAQGPPAALAADRGGNVYLARSDGSVDQSSDGGRSWRPRSRN